MSIGKKQERAGKSCPALLSSKKGNHINTHENPTLNYAPVLSTLSQKSLVEYLFIPVGVTYF